MPDGRFISKSIAVNGQLASISLEADYLFARCIPHLDRDGRMNGEPAIVKATACPLRKEIGDEATPDLIRQLARAGLVRWYQVGAQKVIEFPGFRTHQRGMKYDREAPSRLPAFDSEGSIELAGPTTPDEVRTNSGPTPAKVRDVAPTSLNSEVNGSEVNLSRTDGDANASLSGEPDVRVVFDHWIQATGRSASRTKLTDERRRKIQTRLKRFSAADLCKAIDGVMASEHHRSKAEYTDLVSCFKNDERVESHIERAGRNGGHGGAEDWEYRQPLPYEVDQ